MFVLTLAVFLAAWNNVANLVAAFDSWYVPVNLVVAALLVLLARRRGYGWETLGLSRAHVGAGARWGGAAFGLVAVVIMIAALVPATQPLLADGRIAGAGGAEIAFLALVRIPFGTVVLEEVAFRGVLYGAWSQWRGRVAGAVGSSAVFGLWHLVPTLALLEANDLASAPGARITALAAAVALTAGAGLLFCALRIASGSILAPALAHVATNSLAATAAHLVA